MNWWDLQTSLYKCLADNYGRPRTFTEVLMHDFRITHEWFYIIDQKTRQWHSGTANDLQTIETLRGTNPKEPSYQPKKNLIKQTLQCWTPSGFFKCKKKTQVIMVQKNPILQLDFDNLYGYDIDEVKKAIFDLPFVCYVGRSVSGYGLFALILIDEPQRLTDYAEHCFRVFDHYGISPDTSKGRNYTDLRFVSYDPDFVSREHPTALRIKKFNTPKVVHQANRPAKNTTSSNGLISWAIKQIQYAQVGQRFETVRKVSYTMGGHNCGLDEIRDAIKNCGQYSGVEEKYLLHAEEGFAAGKLKPIIA